MSGDPAQRAVLLEEGVFGWWMAPDFRMSFWRPLSSLTHVVDHRLWPRSSLLAHAQTMLWFAALLAVLAALYRRFHPPWVAHLALLLYAVDDARGWVLGWTANRNALVAATLAFAALLAHDRARRDGWRPGRWLAPALFAAALLGGEAALAVTGYLFAHALFLDSGPLARRLARLWPYAALSLAWLSAYGMLGYGTTGGGMYLNPLSEPTLYLGALVERLPILLAAQVGVGLSDMWLLLPPSAQVVGYALALLGSPCSPSCWRPCGAACPRAASGRSARCCPSRPCAPPSPWTGCSSSRGWERWRRSLSSWPSGCRGTRSYLLPAPVVS